MVRLVRAAAKVSDAHLGSYAIIGGVAVSARLGQAYRATADLDTVVDDLTPPPAIEALLDVPGAHADPTGAHRVLIEGIKVEVQGTEPFAPDDLDGLTDKQILYVGPTGTRSDQRPLSRSSPRLSTLVRPCRWPLPARCS